jgi:hypothetical protein
MAANKSSNKTARIDRDGPKGSRGFVDIARKLGIALPAGLLLLTNMTASAAVNGLGPLGETKISAELEKLGTNEIAERLLAHTKEQVKIASAANCGGIHGDTWINKNDPDVTYQGHHTKVHTNQHGDSCRY